MAKEDKETAEIEAVDGQQEMSETIKMVLVAACKRRGGLRLPIGMRGHRSVSEEITFGPNSLEEVIVRADFTFVLTLNGQRYWLQSKHMNCTAIQRILSYVEHPKEFEFSSGFAFSTAQ